MSEMRLKVVLRAEITELRGANLVEALDFYSNFLGEPNYVDEYKGELLYFEYNGKYRSIYNIDEKKYGIEVILIEDSQTEVEDFKKISMKDLNSLTEDIIDTFDFLNKEDIHLSIYNWYTGFEEPIKF